MRMNYVPVGATNNRLTGKTTMHSLANTLRQLPWQLAARIVLLLGLLGPGVALTIFPDFFSATGSLHIIAVICPPIALGIVLLLAGIAVLVTKYREYGYLVGTIIFTILTVCAVAAFFVGSVHSVLIFALPVVVLAYMEATRDSITRAHGPTE